VGRRHAETDVNGQVNLLQNFIQQGVDGLVYAATDAKVLYQVTKSASNRT
jgi:ribose transport system substrate-binding protein